MQEVFDQGVAGGVIVLGVLWMVGQGIGFAVDRALEWYAIRKGRDSC